MTETERKTGYSLTGEWSVFLLSFCLEVKRMNIAKFIKNHKELSEVPFLIVFRTISILQEMRMINGWGDTGVDRVQS